LTSLPWPGQKKSSHLRLTIELIPPYRRKTQGTFLVLKALKVPTDRTDPRDRTDPTDPTDPTDRADPVDPEVADPEVAAVRSVEVIEALVASGLSPAGASGQNERRMDS
jgi:hypothetical protein